MLALRTDLAIIAAGLLAAAAGLRLIGWAFAALAVYLLAQSTIVLAARIRPGHSWPGSPGPHGPWPPGRSASNGPPARQRPGIARALPRIRTCRL
jgi:hypothetical protein